MMFQTIFSIGIKYIAKVGYLIRSLSIAVIADFLAPESQAVLPRNNGLINQKSRHCCRPFTP
jgi:hypothetical protein